MKKMKILAEVSDSKEVESEELESTADDGNLLNVPPKKLPPRKDLRKLKTLPDDDIDKEDPHLKGD